MQLPTRRLSATRLSWMLFAIMALLCAGCAATTVAQPAVSPLALPVQIDGLPPTCMNDVFGGETNCTAADVRVSQYTLVEGPKECLPGEKIQVKLQAELVAGAQDRYDVGLFIAQDGGEALTGICYRDYLATPLLSSSYNPGTLFVPPAGDDPITYTGGGPFLTSEEAEDLCGDIKQGIHTFRDVGETPSDAGTGPVWVDVVCQDNVDATGASVPDGVADLGTCVSWDNVGDAKPACTKLEDTRPNNKAKCNCSYVQIAGLTVPKVASLEVVKDLFPASDTAKFDLLIEGAVASGTEGVGDGGSTGSMVVSAGTNTTPGAKHTVGEAAHDPDTDMGAYDVSYACLKNGETSAFVSGAGVGPVELLLMPDDNVVCTFTNQAIPRLQLIKEVSNDDGGTAAVTDWTLNAAGARTDEPTDLSGTTPVDSAVLATSFKPDTYTLSETFTGDAAVLGGYTAGAWSCVKSGTTEEVPVSADNQVVINYGDDVTCTITNDDIQPKLKLVKTMDLLYGGTATPADFKASVTDAAGASTEMAWDTFTGLKAGAYNADETGPAGYTPSEWTGDCAEDGTITLLPGDEKTCTITNSDVQPKLRLVKTMDIKYGGTATEADFKASVSSGETGTEVPWNTSTGFNVGEYVVSETVLKGYAASAWGGDCAADGSITLEPGDDKTCTIANSDIQPQLKLIKTMDIQYGGTATAVDFQASVKDANGASTKVAWDAFTGFDVGAYDANETGPAGYTASAWGGDCSEDGAVALLPGDEKTCTITNSDNPAEPGGITAMSWVLHDELIIEDIEPLAGSPAKVTFALFKDKTCEVPWLVEDSPYSETVPITYDGSTGRAATLTGYAHADPGDGPSFSNMFYWKATYSGDSKNPGFTTACGHEITAIGGTTNIAKSRATASLGRLLERIIRGGIEPKASGKTVMSWVLHDALNITGIRPLAGSLAEVTFTLYKDENCRNPWLLPDSSKAPYTETVPITYEGSTGKAATLTGYATAVPGKFYWQAAYSGDAYNRAFTTACGHEIAVIDASTTPMDNIPLQPK